MNVLGKGEETPPSVVIKEFIIKITNDSNEGKTVAVEAGQGFAQGLFMPFGITEDDEVSAMRNGGFGSTTT